MSEEDDIDDEELIRRALRKSALTARVVVVRDGRGALEYLGKGGALPDVVLLDLQLPGLDGHAVLERIRANERTRRLPVVVLTGSVAERDVARSYELGANSYVSKPVDFDRFARTVETLGRYWLQVNQPAT